MTNEELQQLLMMMRQYMSTGKGTDPFAPEVGLESSAMFEMLPPSYDKKGNIEPTDLEARSKQYNIMQDWGDLNSDPAILGGIYGSGPGSFDRKALEPARSYEYLPGQQMLDRVLGSTSQDSLEYMIADEIANGGTPSSAVKYIQTIMEDPESEEAQALSRSLPMAEGNNYDSELFGDVNIKQPDYGRVWDIANSYQDAILSDPVANGYDEEGRPAVVTEEESEMARWFRETGTPLPDEQYPIESLMDDSQIRRRDRNRAAFLDTEAQFGETNADATRLGQQMQARQWPQDMLAPPGRGGAGPVAPAAEQGRGSGVYADENGTSYFNRPDDQGNQTVDFVTSMNDLAADAYGTDPRDPPLPPSSGGQRAERGRDAASAVQRGMASRQQPSLMGGVADGAYRTSDTARNEATEKNWKVRESATQDFVDNQVRKLVLRQMAQAGHTPYNDTMAGRRMMAQYGGFG